MYVNGDYKGETGVQMASRVVEEYGDERAAQAFQQGAQQKAEETAIKMLSKHYPVEDVVELTDLTEEKVLELKNKIEEKQ